MRFVLSFTLMLASVTTLVSAYGYKYSRNPYTGECKLQLSLPGGLKDAYGGAMSTRYGSNHKHSESSVGKYGGHGQRFHGAASSPHSSFAKGSYGSGSSSSNDNYGGGSYSGGYGGNSGNYAAGSGNYGGSSGGSSSNYESSSGNYGSSSNQYDSSKYASNSGNYGDYEPADNYGGSNSNYGNNNNNYGSSSNRGSSSSKGNNYESHGSSNRGSSASSSSNRENSYGGNRDRDYSSEQSYGSSGHNHNSGSSGYNRDRNTGSNYGGSSSGYNRDRDTDYDNSQSQHSHRDRESSYGSSSNKYGSSSSASGHRESGSGSSSSSSDKYRPSHDRESNRHTGDRGSNSYGSSSAETYDQDRNRKKPQKTNTDDEYLMKEFSNEVLSTHNSYRAKHTTPPVTLDEKMSLKAQEWAYDLASGRVAYGHSPEAIEGIYGESLQILNDPSATATDAVTNWYKERYNYNFRNPVLIKSPRSRSNSHFAAIVWKATRKIGVGKATSNNGRTFVVVNYWPPGNIVDVLEDNVLPPRTDVSSSSREALF